MPIPIGPDGRTLVKGATVTLASPRMSQSGPLERRHNKSCDWSQPANPLSNSAIDGAGSARGISHVMNAFLQQNDAISLRSFNNPIAQFFVDMLLAVRSESASSGIRSSSKGTKEKLRRSTWWRLATGNKMFRANLSLTSRSKTSFTRMKRDSFGSSCLTKHWLSKVGLLEGFVDFSLFTHLGQEVKGAHNSPGAVQHVRNREAASFGDRKIRKTKIVQEQRSAALLQSQPKSVDDNRLIRRMAQGRWKVEADIDDDLNTLWADLRGLELAEDDLEDYLAVDDLFAIGGTLTLPEIAADVSTTEVEEPESDTDVMEIDEEPVLPPVTSREAKAAVQVLLRFSSNPVVLQLCDQVNDLIAQELIKKLKQKSILNYFVANP